MAENDGGVNIEISIEMEKLKGQMEQFVASMGNVEKEFSVLNTSIDKLEKSQEDLLKTQSQIVTASEKTASAASNMEKHFKAEDEAIKEITDSTERLEAAQHNYNSALDEIEKGLKWAKDIDNIDKVAEAQIRLNETVKAYTEFRALAGNAGDNPKIIEEKKKKIDALRNAYDKAEKENRKFTKQISDFIKKVKDGKASVDDLAHAMQVMAGIKGTISAVAGVFGKIKAAMDECAEAYRVQAAAETALSTAARNNPYLDGMAVQRLKDFASHVQSYSAVGDETLLPLMAKLAAAGRTQEEIQGIITASVDIAASGAMSLDSAVNNLNKTFSGLSGELGENVPAIKALTAEELKQGKAIKVLGDQYKGMAKAVTDATGTAELLKGAWGDFQEAIGQGWEEKAAPMRTYFADILNNITKATLEANKMANAIKLANGTASAEKKTELTVEQNKNERAVITKKEELAKLEARIKTATENNETALAASLEASAAAIRNEIAAYNESIANIIEKMKDTDGLLVEAMSEEQVANYRDAVASMIYDKDAYEKQWKEFQSMTDTSMPGSITKAQWIDDYEKRLLDMFERLTKRQEDFKKDITDIPEPVIDTALQDKYNKAVEKYKQTLAQFEEELKHRKATGEEITQEAEAQERLNITTRAYIAMRMEAGNSMSDDNSFAKEQLVYVGGLADVYGKLAEESGNFAKVIDDINALCDETDNIVEQSVKFIKDMGKAEREVSDAVLEQVDAIDEKKRLLKKETDALKEKVAENEKELSLMDARSQKAKELAAENERLNEQIKKQTEAEENLSRARETALRQLGDQVEAEKELTRIKKEQELVDSAMSLVQDRRSKRQKRKDEKNTLSQAKETLEKKLSPANEKVSQMDAEIQAMQEAASRGEQIEQEKLDKLLSMRQRYADDVADLERQISDITIEQSGRQREAVQESLEEITSFVGQAGEIMNGLLDMAKQRVNEQADSERTDLAEQYNSGAIDYEEYCEKKAELERKFAREQYKIELAEWANKVLLATANTALAVVNAMTNGDGYTAAIRGAIVGALGAIQIASVVASKPKAPSFAGGGIVPGRSYYGDKMQANVNSGEMILNASQQKELWGMANGQNAANGNTVLNVKVINNASDSVKTSQSLDPQGLVLTIDKIVNDSMRKGKYNQSMDTAQAGREGERWL